MKKIFVCLLFVCGLTSCGSINYISIDTFNPAEVTYPKNVKRVLIVNNAVPQPSNLGYTYKLSGVVQDTARARTDSALIYTCSSLGKAIADAPLFDDVLLYHNMTRNDSDYLEDKRLSPEDVKNLCKETGTDAIISVDRMLFQMEKDVYVFAEGYITGTIDIKMSGVLRSYYPGRENPLATIYVNDSIFWSEDAGNMHQLRQVLPSPTEALNEAGSFIGEKSVPNFIPHWNKDSRWYYTGMGSLWKQAAAYITTEKWDEAAVIWKKLYNSASWSTQAKAASNLALYYEINSKFEEALEWATKAQNLFEKNKGGEDSQTQIQKLYTNTLNARLMANKKLNMQLGKE